MNSAQHGGENEQEWLRAEYEHMWTMQSDINTRMVTVYTVAMTIGFSLLGALGAWAASDAGKAPDINPYLRLLLFVLPSALALVLFLHNLSQRREVVLLGAYWRIMVEHHAGRRTWAGRVEVYRKVHRRLVRPIPFVASANQPIPTSYATLYFSSSTIGALSFALRLPNEPSLPLSAICIASYVLIGLAHIRLRSEWEDVIPIDFEVMKKVWIAVANSETRHGPPPQGIERRTKRRRATDA